MDNMSNEKLNHDLIRLIGDESDIASKFNLAMVNHMFRESIKFDTFAELLNQRFESSIDFVKYWLQFENTSVSHRKSAKARIQLINHNNDECFKLNCINGFILNENYRRCPIGSIFLIDFKRLNLLKLGDLNDGIKNSPQTNQLMNHFDKIDYHFDRFLTHSEKMMYDSKLIDLLHQLKTSNHLLNHRIKIYDHY